MTHEHPHRGTQVSDMLALRTNANGTSAGLTTNNAQVVQTVDEVGAIVLSTMHCVLLSLSSLTGGHAQSNAKVAVIYRASDDGTGDVIVVINMYNSKVMYSKTRAVYTLSVHNCDSNTFVALVPSSSQCGSFTLQNIPRDGTWNVAFNGDDKKYSPLNGGCGTGQSVTINNGSGTLQLPEYAMLILTQ